MSYKIVAQYYKDISFEIPDAKTALLLEKDIKNYKFICDINSEKVKNNWKEADEGDWVYSDDNRIVQLL